MSFGDLARNWVAAIKLPFVYMGLAKDFWSDFDERYLELEKGLPSTFFVIPRKNYAGKRVDGRAAALRASSYEAKELADTICKLRAAGCEVGLHGIDAWVDSGSGREELEEIRRLTGVSEIGVRMHWLYYDEKSPALLESAEAAYDSTSGYNETVGYRAGTTQAYKPLGVERLLELPLHAMDTALFYLSYLGLSPRKARARLRQLADNAVRFGGTLTINWHDRSLAPERLWGGCYRDLIQALKSRGAWFSTAGQAVSWFRKRRSAGFETDLAQPGAVRAKVAVDQGDRLPGLRLRIHKARKPGFIGSHPSEDYVDITVEQSIETRVPSEAAR
jgi:peptidoglycan/xylan/chitin deacetylase (PgdA/CDA1 family)